MGVYYLLFGAMLAIPILILRAAGMEYDIQYIIYTTGLSEGVMLASPTFAIGAFLGAILIKNFNGERGKRSKWLFYVVYPAHLAVIAAIGVALGVISFNLFGFSF